MNQATLQTLAGRFDKLSMSNPLKRLISKEETANHPYEFLVSNFPTFNDFYDYFAECAATWNGPKPFAETLFGIYHDLRDLPVAVEGMNRGIKPANMEKIFQSMRTFNELTRTKFSRANTWLAQNYASKH